MSLSRESEKCFNLGENRTRDLGVTSPHALPSELHGQPDLKTVNYDIERSKESSCHFRYSV